jgi:hypothetical protein
MALSLNIAAMQVGAALNAIDPTQYSFGQTLSGTGVLNDSERRAVQEIYDALVSADGDVVRLICQTPGHGHRRDFFTTQTNVTHTGQLTSPGAGSPGRIGPVESVIFSIAGGSAPGPRPAVEFDKLEIYYENLNPMGLISIDPHYSVEGETVYHNGAALAAITGGVVSVNVTFCAYARGNANPPVLQSPDEYTNPVVAKALAMLFAKEGHHTEAGGFYEQVWQAYAKDIAEGATSLRSLPALAQG